MLSYKEKTKMICLKCSFRNNDSKNFCAKCGNNLKEYVAEPSVEIQPEQYFQHGPEVIDDKATGFITSRINERKTLYSDMPPELKHANKKDGIIPSSEGGFVRKGSGLKKFVLAGIAVLVAAIVISGIILFDSVSDDTDKKKADVKDKKKNEEVKPEDRYTEKVSDAGLKRMTHDIKLGRSDVSELDVADFLIKVRNDNDYAVKAIDFIYSIDGDIVKNALDDSELFYAYGYVKPDTEGYMYCRMHVSDGYTKNLGNIEIVNAYSTDLVKYNIPEGVVTGHHLDGDKDSYDVDIANNNSKPLSSNSKIIVVCEGRDDVEYPLEEAWGCGDMKEEVGGHDFASIPNAITNAGMKHYGEKNYPKVLVLDRDMLDVDVSE